MKATIGNTTITYRVGKPPQAPRHPQPPHWTVRTADTTWYALNALLLGTLVLEAIA